MRGEAERTAEAREELARVVRRLEVVEVVVVERAQAHGGDDADPRGQAPEAAYRIVGGG